MLSWSISLKMNVRVCSRSLNSLGRSKPLRKTQGSQHLISISKTFDFCSSVATPNKNTPSAYKDKVSGEAPDTNGLALDLWESNRPGDGASVEVLGAKAILNKFNQLALPSSSPPRTSKHVLAWQVAPDLEKFMQTIRDKINNIVDMKGWLESGKSDATGQCNVQSPYTICAKVYQLETIYGNMLHLHLFFV